MFPCTKHRREHSTQCTRQLTACFLKTEMCTQNTACCRRAVFPECILPLPPSAVFSRHSNILTAAHCRNYSRAGAGLLSHFRHAESSQSQGTGRLGRGNQGVEQLRPQRSGGQQMRVYLLKLNGPGTPLKIVCPEYTPGVTGNLTKATITVTTKDVGNFFQVPAGKVARLSLCELLSQTMRWSVDTGVMDQASCLVPPAPV